MANQARHSKATCRLHQEQCRRPLGWPRDQMSFRAQQARLPFLATQGLCKTQGCTDNNMVERSMGLHPVRSTLQQRRRGGQNGQDLHQLKSVRQPQEVGGHSSDVKGPMAGITITMAVMMRNASPVAWGRDFSPPRSTCASMPKQWPRLRAIPRP